MYCGRRRGSVVLLAIAVVALLFVIGSTLLFVSNQERKTAQEAAGARDFRAIDNALTQGVMLQLRNDLVGDNRIPYDGK